MRRVRGEAGVSLRELETRGSWRRSTISQVENGKARPSRQLVEWVDSELGSDGLLLSIYAEARSRQLVAVRQSDDAADIVHTIDVDPPAGLLVNRAARLQARVTVANGGTTHWRDRRLRRMGAYAGLRLISSPREVAVPDLAPGDHTDVIMPVRAPELPGTAIAYWSLVDSAGRECAPASPPIALLFVVE
jgi:transcriptional regulator with XRE-family HTH domain